MPTILEGELRLILGQDKTDIPPEAMPALIILAMGVLLILVAIVGGGLEVKEFKIPKIEKTGRILTASLGTILMVAGFCIGAYSTVTSLAAPAPTSTTELLTPVPTTKPQMPSDSPDTSLITTANIRIESSEISSDVQRAAAELIVAADKAEIYAEFYQDDSYLKQYYAGDAFQRIQQNIEMIRNSGYIVVSDLDVKNSYYMDMKLIGNGSVLAVDECEYWKTYMFDPQTKALVTETTWQLIPQTINIEFVGDNAKITSISFYQGNAFCTQ